jgi:diguanylate cyclase (GGDEF)-like protein/PAS domain S-box-containing protein
LGGAFAVLIAILLAIGQLGLHRMHTIDDTLSNITGSKATDLELARRAMLLSDENNRIVMEIVLVENRRLVEPLMAARSQNSEEIAKLIAESESRCDSEKERQLLSEVAKARRPYQESYERAIHLLVDERKHDEAEAVVINETLPALHAYHAAWERFVQFQKKELDAAIKRAEDDRAKARHLASLLIGLAVVLAILIALFATSRTAHEIAARNDAQKEVNQLNAGLEERVMERTGELVIANQELSLEVNKRQKAQESYRQEVISREDVEVDLRRSDERMRMAVEAARIGFWDWDVIKDKQIWSDVCKELLGLRPESAANLQVLMNSVHPDDRKMIGDGFQAAIKEKREYGLEFRVIWPDGSVHWQAAKGRAFYDGSGRAIRMSGIAMDITASKVAEEQIQYLAYYDALTGLPNRTLLQDRLARALAVARRQKHKLAILFFDLDRFKDINDSLGHSVGDLLLQEVAERLKKWAREQDTVARLGGDEFLLLLTHVKDVPDAAVAAERLMDAITTEFVIQGHIFNVSCSVGISIFPEHGADPETLIKNADAAMYSAKDNGCDNFRFFTADMNAQILERLTLENRLRLALEKKQLFLVYQPQVDIASGRITGLEALLRWEHPELGLVPPDKFIGIAENSGLILPIGEWVLRTACSQARAWQDQGLPPVTIAVNISVVQFRQDGFCALIRKVLDETGLAPQYLELELTESLLLANADLMLSVVQELKAMGVTLAIDDFGTGYSSFSYLRQFRVSKLKIDRVFVRDVALNSDDAAIAAAIISMAKSLHLKVIAEGVENEAQMSFLRGHQCDEIQGYYFSKPLAFDKVADKLRSNLAETQAEHKPTGDHVDNKPNEVSISLMSIGLALLVSADPVTIQQFSLALRELSISPDACQDGESAALLLKRRKFDAVIVDLKLGNQSGLILDEVRLSPSNRTAVTFGIGDNGAAGTAAFRKKSQFVFERPLSAESIRKTLKPAYGLILRERRRYYRCPVSTPVIIRKDNGHDILCNSVNISGGGMALNTGVPLVAGEEVGVEFTLPDHKAPVLATATICWMKTGHIGLRFVSLSQEHKSELQVWLSEKLEQILPEFVAEQFRNAESAEYSLAEKPNHTSDESTEVHTLI